MADVSKRTDITRLRPHWSNIAQDLVLTKVPNNAGGMLLTPQQICDNYEMSSEEFLQLMRLPEFSRMVKDIQTRFNAMGDNASITLRAQLLAADMMEEAFIAAKRPGADLKDKVALMKLLFQYGQLDPATNGTNKAREDGGGGTVAQVIINVPAGIPGMEHVRAKEVQGVTINGEAS